MQNEKPVLVVGLTIRKRYARVRAWREYLRLTQKEAVERIRAPRAAISQMESREERLRKVTLENLAAATSIGVAQLR